MEFMSDPIPVLEIWALGLITPMNNKLQDNLEVSLQ